jgi:N-acylneuraminate cytidylyltransferase
MIHGKSVLGVIAARGGSKEIPRKNVRMVSGKPLMAWTIAAAKASRYIDRLILSSDDPEIIAVAAEHGCEAPFVRSPALATDEAKSIDVVLDAVARCPQFDWVVLLQPTSPLRLPDDIDGTLERAFALGAPAGVTVCLAKESPYWMFSLDADGALVPLIHTPAIGRRQDLPKAYLLNGAVYAADCAWLVRQRTFIGPETIGYEMPLIRSADIDTEQDLENLRFTGA